MNRVRLWLRVAAGLILLLVRPSAAGASADETASGSAQITRADASVTIRAIIADGQSYSGEQSPRLPPGTRHVEIRFNASRCATDPECRFRYRLDGYDRNWVTTQARAVAYARLQPGQYRFHVSSCDRDGRCDDTTAAVRFSVRPAWYQASWLPVLVLLALSAAVTVSHRWRVNQLTARTRELAKLANELAQRDPFKRW